MKKLFIFPFITSLLVINLIEASDSTMLKPGIKELGIQLRATGIGPLFKDKWNDVFAITNNELHLKYTVSGKRFYTLGFYINGLSESTEERDSVQNSRRGLRTNTHNASQFGFVLIPGMEWHFPGTRRIDPFIGAQLPLGYIGKFKEKDVIEENSIRISSGIPYESNITDELVQAGGFSFGLRGAIGMNYYLTNRIAFGIDYTISMTFTKLGGNQTDTHSTSLKDGTINTNTKTVTNNFDNQSQLEISNKGILGLNFLIFLGKLK